MVGGAQRAMTLVARVSQGGQEHADQQGDDRNDDKQFEKGERRSPLSIADHISTG
ncbi:MAG: hypothetical protein L6Q93_10085 [Phycisphaerae bacterium]|nr:hypothetical protein [Phycisphaerae bacterium]